MDAHPALFSNLWKKKWLLLVFYQPQKKVRDGAILKLSFGTTKMVACVNKGYVCLFVTKNIGIFIATGLIVKR